MAMISELANSPMCYKAGVILQQQFSTATLSTGDNSDKANNEKSQGTLYQKGRGTTPYYKATLRGKSFQALCCSDQDLFPLCSFSDGGRHPLHIRPLHTLPDWGGGVRGVVGL